MIKKIIKKFCVTVLKFVFPPWYKTRGTAAPITFRGILLQKILGFNRRVYWPTHFSSVISNPENIKIGIGTAPGLSAGCYIQGTGKLFIGDYTIVAPNVGIITANHSLFDYNQHVLSTVRIGSYCWLGMNSVVLPNVILGDHVIVAAGSVVTKSFKEGYCVIGGNPAKMIKKLEQTDVEENVNEYEYYGYIAKHKFEKFRKLNLNV